MRKRLSVRRKMKEEEKVEFDLIVDEGNVQLILTKPDGINKVMLEIKPNNFGEIRIWKAGCFDPLGSGIKVDVAGHIIIEDY